MGKDFIQELGALGIRENRFLGLLLGFLLVGLLGGGLAGIGHLVVTLPIAGAVLAVSCDLDVLGSREDVLGALVDQGAAMMGLMVSPLTGADGNVEFLVHLAAHTPMPSPAETEIAAAIATVVAEATAAHGIEHR